MGKAGRWLRSFLAGKKDGKIRDMEKQGQGDATPVAASPREKKRWSFRRSASPGKAAAATSPLTPEQSVPGGAGLVGGGCLSLSERELEQSKHAMVVAVATAAAADAAVAAAQAAAAAIRLTDSESDLSASLVEEAAAVRIQATFRGYLARKALGALRGLVKLQALIRGHLVRKQAIATLRRMQALLLAQSGLRAQRMRMLEDDHAPHPAAAHAHRRSPQHPRHRRSYEMDRSGEEQVKIVEMDIGEPPRRGRSSCSIEANESRERRLAEYYGQCSPAPSAAFTELMSPRAYSGHFEDFASFELATARSSPYVPGFAAAAAEPVSEFFPNYMANTESSRAKARSQSAPRQRTDSPFERQPSRRHGPGVPRSVKMQRSSSHVGAPASAAAAGYAHYQYQYPWSVKLDRSRASLKDSECGSTSSVLTAATVSYCRSLVGFEVRSGQH